MEANVKKPSPYAVMKVMEVSFYELIRETKLSRMVVAATLQGIGPANDKARKKIAKVLCMKVDQIGWTEPLDTAGAHPPGEEVVRSPSELPVKKAPGVCDVHFLALSAAGNCSYCDT